MSVKIISRPNRFRLGKYRIELTTGAYIVHARNQREAAALAEKGVGRFVERAS